MKKGFYFLPMVLLLVLSLLVIGCAEQKPAPTTQAPTATTAVKPITLRVGTPFKQGVATGWAMEEYAKRVEAGTNGRVKFQMYFADTLVASKDMLSALNSGIADIGKMVYTTEQAPWQVFPQMPGVFADSELELAGKATYKVSMGGKVEEEWAKLGVKPIYAWTLSNYQLGTSKKAVKTLADLSGLKIRTSGGILAQSIQSLGGVPVSMTTQDLYDALTKGVVDGAALAVPSFRTEAFFELLGMFNLNFNFGGYPQYDNISLKVWNTIPRQDQDIMTKIGEQLSSDAPVQYLKQISDDTALFKSLGKQIFSLSPEDMATMKTKLAPIRETWLKDMDGKGFTWVRKLVTDWETAIQQGRR